MSQATTRVKCDFCGKFVRLEDGIAVEHLDMQKPPFKKCRGSDRPLILDAKLAGKKWGRV